MLQESIEIDNSILEHMKSLTLLCVEDDPTTQILYQAIFEDFVKEIILANNGEDGYDKFLTNNIDLVLSDYDMPKINGLEMIKKIRKSDKDIPII